MNEAADQSISECQRCGTCCVKGGPSLHLEDKELLTNGHIKHEQLITIRKGEMALSPSHEEPETIEKELIKIAGKGKDWECICLDRDGNSCTIYEHRPLECRVLECWDTSELESIAGQNTLTRADIIAPDNPINEFIKLHELKCPVPEPYRIRAALSSEADAPQALAQLTEIVRMDLAIRAEAVRRFDIPLSLELFYFGRPIHVMLNSHGLRTTEKDGIIQITAKAPQPFSA
jgi:Fe-S-cluster containining protein